MRVILSKDQARYLLLDTKMELVRSCFYIGMGIDEIRKYVIAGPFAEQEVEALIRTAYQLGMTEDDVVVVKE